MTVERHMRKSANISIRTDPALKDALEFCAIEDNRSLAGLVEKILKDWATERGWYKEKPRTYRVPKPAARRA